MSKTASEYEIKRKRLQGYMEKKDIKAILLAKKSNFFWATCGGRSQIVDYSDIGFSYLLITKEKFYLVTTNIEEKRMLDEEMKEVLDLESVSYMWFDEKGLAESISQIVDISSIYQDWPLLEKANMLGPDFEELKFDLTSHEKKRYYDLCSDTSKCMSSICRDIRPGMSEFDVQAGFSERLISVQVMPLLILIGSDERLYEYRHPVPTGKEIRDYVMVVVCGLRKGLIACCTRLVHFGPPPEEVLEARKIITDIDARLILSSRPGKRYSDIFEKEAEVFGKYGHEDEWKNHHQGGPLGYEGRYFLVNSSTEQEVRKDNAIAWNPSIRGFKSEDTIIVEDDGNQVATHDEDWPSITVENELGIIKRPDILIK